jgi:hypothetical protein
MILNIVFACEPIREDAMEKGGETPKTICPKCEKEYLKTIWMLENRKYMRVGLGCPNVHVHRPLAVNLI